VIALVGDALAVAIDPMPRIETSDGPLLHIETAPAAIGTAGSPNVVAVCKTEPPPRWAVVDFPRKKRAPTPAGSR
jgi:hypothetical protein